MSGEEMSGVDLARVALRAAREAARKNGGGRKTKQRPRPARMARRDGREPTGLAATIDALVTERAWELPAFKGGGRGYQRRRALVSSWCHVVRRGA
ncbi:hypothetical protein AB0K09_31845 [Streptomyces sp. NPDC049577]|uniref:hypothetical protein n=1 Tax=Streptomyces sp. NPDC049577 TaxID=3155153 RepID=UPI003447FFC8